jgi:hypothetical protein
MGVLDWIRKSFISEDTIPADFRRLSADAPSSLASSLKRLEPGERGWISFSEAARLFSTADPAYAFGEMDDEGKQKLSEFAASHGSEIQFMPVEARVYFKRSSP